MPIGSAFIFIVLFFRVVVKVAIDIKQIPGNLDLELGSALRSLGSVSSAVVWDFDLVRIALVLIGLFSNAFPGEVGA